MGKLRLFHGWRQQKSRDETFCIMLPPPNVTGHLHVGHAFNHTLMDILTRWKRMQGFDTLWQPGLDHAGIATQLMVEKQMAADGETRKRSEMPRDEFLAKVWAWKGEKGGVIEQQARRLGDSMDGRVPPLPCQAQKRRQSAKSQATFMMPC